MLNRLPHLLVLLAAVALLAGCSRDLGPKTYTDEVKTNYMNTCVDGSTEKLCSLTRRNLSRDDDPFSRLLHLGILASQRVALW